MRLHDYQEEAVRFLHSRERGAGLFLDMGLGDPARLPSPSAR